MQITLVETELREALQNYLSTLMTIPSGKKFEMDFQATRGANGFSAVVNIVDASDVAKVSMKVEEKPKGEDSSDDDSCETLEEPAAKKKSLFSGLG